MRRRRLLAGTRTLAAHLASGPTFAHGMTKRMLQQEWSMGVEEAIEAEAQAQAICMATNDFHRAYQAFVGSRSRPSRAIERDRCGLLDWPFFEERHRALGGRLEEWAVADALLNRARMSTPRVAVWCVTRRRGLAQYAVRRDPTTEVQAPTRYRHREPFCLARETLAWHSGLADFVFAMQGLGSGAITLVRQRSQRQRTSVRAVDGTAIAAFALSEPDAGSGRGGDAVRRSRVAGSGRDGMSSMARRCGSRTAVLADLYVVFARTGEAPGPGGISAFVVDADTPGFACSERIEVMAPHPLGRADVHRLPDRGGAAPG